MRKWKYQEVNTLEQSHTGGVRSRINPKSVQSQIESVSITSFWRSTWHLQELKQEQECMPELDTEHICHLLADPLDKVLMALSRGLNIPFDIFLYIIYNFDEWDDPSVRQCDRDERLDFSHLWLEQAAENNTMKIFCFIVDPIQVWKSNSTLYCSLRWKDLQRAPWHGFLCKHWYKSCSYSE